MRLVRAHIENFKLLEDIVLDFSANPERPLTVFRAENGSGKTSVLYALMWGIFGMSGLPKAAQTLRLTSSACPVGQPVEVSVMIEFDHLDDGGSTTRYRLIRSITETPTVNERPNRPTEARLRLYKTTGAGEEEVSSPESLREKLLPLHLREVFFTDGDSVQTFITRESSQQTQEKVQRSIRSLLGLDTMRKTKDDLDTVVRKMNSDASKAGGQDTTTRQKACDDTDADLATNQAERDTLSERLNNMNEDKTRKERALTALRGHGDLDEINRRLDQLRTTGAGLEATRASTLTRMRKLLSADACSWAFLHKSLTQAISVLDELADRNIIPGTAVEVLTDRLDLGVCICGHDISSDSDHRRHVEQLRDEQRQVSEQSAQLTALFHRARADQAETEARRERADGFSDLRQALLSEFTSNRDLLAQTTRDIVLEEERRAAIDEPRVQALTAALQALDKKTAELSEGFGAVKSRILVLEERREEQGRQLEAAEKATKISSNLLLRRDVARDLLSLAANTLDTLEHDYVLRVSDRMNDLFMQIVGSDPNFEAGVFTGVHIDDRCNIVVDTHGGRSLDTDFELNGASQRALTLAFIWALMEVSGTTAPRTIDTPLGMVSTGVKYRMVDAITSPAIASSPDFQVVLLLTRSEIRDVEDLLDERAGLVRTLSCSKDYPKDLTHPWGADHPLVRVCTCTHRQSCLICARVYDEQYGIDFRNEEASV